MPVLDLDCADCAACAAAGLCIRSVCFAQGLLLAFFDGEACPRAPVHGRSWKDSLAPPVCGENSLRSTPAVDFSSSLQKTWQSHAVQLAVPLLT